MHADLQGVPNELTPLNRIRLQKLMAAQLAKKLDIYENLRFTGDPG
jgi:hypothetical protein